MKQLREVKVGAMTYSFSEIPNLRDGEKEIDAQVNYTTVEMRIRKGLCRDRRSTCILHEAVHAILENAGQEASEGMVDAIAYGMYALLSDNPGLVKHVTRR